MSLLHDYYVSNYSKCSKPDSFLSSWEGLSLVSHSITAVLLPFHLLGGYCILCKTPAYMTFYRWPLFNLHFWSCFVDILISALITPYLIFPAVAGFPIGLLSVFNVPTAVQIWLGVVCIYAMIMSMTILFENRHNSIPSNKLRIERMSVKLIYYAIRIALLVLYSSFIFLFVPEQEPARLQILQSIPCPTEEFFTSPVFVLCINDTYTNFLAAVTALGVLSEILQIAFFVACCLYYLFFSLNGFTSKKTRKLQIAFFASIVMQSCSSTTIKARKFEGMQN
ncbi:unnamed protein product [Caenorhabditis sp. 36 PRJEB53466]|nr:unnamed protein product [Caenorhabditis sp. 36 PRJEB53466]